MAGYFFGCPHCRAKLETIDATRAGRAVICPKCQQSLIIPPPPKMGVALTQAGDHSPLPPSADASQVVVSSDPGFKRPMSPAKAYSESDSVPAPNSSRFDRLLPAESLDTSPAHIIEATQDVEGYSFLLPENGAEEAPKLPKAKKVRSPKPEEVDPPSPWEDPKRQLAVLVGVVVLIAGFTAWMRRSGDKHEKPDQVAAPEVKPALPSPSPAVPASMPGDTATPGGLTGLPGAIALPPPVSTTADGALPGAAPNPPSASDVPADSPGPQPESPPNVVPPPAANEVPSAVPVPE